MKNIKRTILTLCLALAMVLLPSIKVDAGTYHLNDEQKDIAKEIQKVCTENWQEYGILPSVCIAQAYMESHIGEVCYANNLWGLYGGYQSYDTLDDGIMAYLELLNSYDSYSNALWRIDYKAQIEAIYDGGYCTTSKDEYVGGIIWIIENFNLSSYDSEILKNCSMKTSDECETWKKIID